MSVKLMNAVYDAHFRDIIFDAQVTKKDGTVETRQVKIVASTAKSVTLALADHANDEGEGAYPSITKLRDKTEFSIPTIVNTLKALKSEGIIFYVGWSKRGTSNYTINVEKLAEMAKWERQERHRATKATLVEVLKPLESPTKATLVEPSYNHPLTNNDTFGIVEGNGKKSLSETDTVSEPTPLPEPNPLPENRLQPSSERQRRTAVKVLGDPLDGMLHFGRLAQQRNAIEDAIQQYPADVQAILREIVKVFSFPEVPQPSKSKGGRYAQWIRELRYLLKLCEGHGLEPIQWAYEANQKRPREISHPGALNSLVFNALREYRSIQEKQQEALQLQRAAAEREYAPPPATFLQTINEVFAKE